MISTYSHWNLSASKIEYGLIRFTKMSLGWLIPLVIYNFKSIRIGPELVVFKDKKYEQICKKCVSTD